MEVKLYQIDLDRDAEGRAFMSQEALARMGADPMVIDSSIYDCVFYRHRLLLHERIQVV